MATLKFSEVVPVPEHFFELKGGESIPFRSLEELTPAEFAEFNATGKQIQQLSKEKFETDEELLEVQRQVDIRLRRIIKLILPDIPTDELEGYNINVMMSIQDFYLETVPKKKKAKTATRRPAKK